MRMFTRVIAAVVALALIVSTIVFILENQQKVSLVFLGWSSPELFLAIPIIVALLAGMLIGPLLGWVVVLRKKRKLDRRSI
ncbi:MULTISPECIES: lipopolysaccharide assembly protein LapA domain-containing protein [Pseudomonas]|uniref:lipopolysaccharide assembly protein LapA domain-containing protein n=1 Tax=Pseudomonas TaxID=286 RepID=UPI000408880B|nr:MULTISPECIES: lipopolysaccharide assembly protein LapA domain-containing protein [Pseudomonas]MCQ2999070.1 lipopolysaccharide assembly protein LapA domain-containing protein [Pseudomonas syringae]MDG6404226.1 lipopolysaccharide assembly protein LapA domain-containing protein [Pseudomonas quasicaspiana]MCQ3032871.1 lipopolysaccharide assembly protein LapA domain-containing protein [Pseudomonas syringae]MDU8362138.1 lipopolysaccharide assembly protein LapA domain-containing protein [Pseudomona